MKAIILASSNTLEQMTNITYLYAIITPPSSAEEKEAEKMTEDRIIKNVLKAYQTRANIKWTPKDYTDVSWNTNDEMIIQ